MIDKCIICGETIFRGGRYIYAKGKKQRRGKKDITCCKKCSRSYVRVFCYITNTLGYKPRVKKK